MAYFKFRLYLKLAAFKVKIKNNRHITKFKNLKNCAFPTYWKMEPIQDGGQNSVGTKTKHAGVKLSGTKIKCIIIRSIAYQSKPSAYELDYLHINQGRLYIN